MAARSKACKSAVFFPSQSGCLRPIGRRGFLWSARRYTDEHSGEAMVIDGPHVSECPLRHGEEEVRARRGESDPFNSLSDDLAVICQLLVTFAQHGEGAPTMRFAQSARWLWRGFPGRAMRRCASLGCEGLPALQWFTCEAPLSCTLELSPLLDAFVPERAALPCRNRWAWQRQRDVFTGTFA